MTGSPWEEVLSAALVGTARRGAPAAAAELDAAGLGGAGLATLGAPEAVLLATAGVLTARRRAGRRPDEAPRRRPEPAAPDPRPACSAAAADVLELLLSGEIALPGGAAVLVGQWLDGAVRAGCRAPDRLLPRLLDLGTARPEFRDRLAAVAGPRGRWLALHHEPWSWASGPAEPDDGAGEPVERRFATASRPERLALLRRLRAEDPDRARELLAATWAKEPAAERAALLETLLVVPAPAASADQGPDDADEPFLEAALDDRAAAVRAVAAALLDRLPRSRRAARMAERLRPLLTLADEPDGPTLAIARPAKLDGAARRDGVGDAAPSGTGRKMWWLIQFTAGAPLDFWTEHLGTGPAGVVGLVAGTMPELLAGLEQAVAAQSAAGPGADPAWALAIFGQRLSAPALASLPPAMAVDALSRFLRTTNRNGLQVAALLDAVPGPWSLELSTTVLDRYRHLGGRAAPELSGSLPTLAERLDPATVELVETWSSTLAGHDALRRRILSLAHALSLRAVLAQELACPT